ncbi:MAG: phosphate regulon sensor histidine kinase PhoR [Nitrosomonadales bacterium]|nr:phosphate regulon sensor histidine kinase PhoR [Nitrosomonadales bacterium]
MITVIDFWRRALVFPFALLLVSLLLWALAGALPAALFFGVFLLARLVFHLRQLGLLEYWLADPEGRPAPDDTGLWEEVFARLNRMMRLNRVERARHNAALQHMEQATSALPEGVVMLDEADHIEWCNPLAEQHFGLDCVRDIGQQITYMARQPEFVQYLAMRNFSEPLVLRGARQDGLTLSIKLIPYSGNKKLLISRDNTRFERIETMRRDFVANVSHELRTPLTVVNGFVETLHDMPSLENDMARRALHLMGEQTQRMERLVNDLLTLSKLDNALNALQEEKVDMAALLRALYHEGQALSGNRHSLQLELESSCAVLGNAEELRSAFSNLVSNAIRYTPQGGEIMLRWWEQDGQPVFSVRDSGIGIAPQHIPRLTERFYRVDRSRSRETGGTGLGLAIVKHVANRHQARLEIASEEGKGSTFSIAFPAKRRLPLPEEEASA